MNSDEFVHYPAALAEEVRKLRWLIERHPSNLELRYYLVLVLAASGRCRPAFQECRQILALDYKNLLARVWLEFLARNRTLGLTHRGVLRWSGPSHVRPAPLKCARPRTRISHE